MSAGVEVAPSSLRQLPSSIQSLDKRLQEFHVQGHLHDDAEYERDYFFVRLLFCIDKNGKKLNGVWTLTERRTDRGTKRVIESRNPRLRISSYA